MEASNSNENDKNDLLYKLRVACVDRGVIGRSKLGRLFRRLDSDKSNKLDFVEFKRLLQECKLDVLGDDDCEGIFRAFDTNKSGNISLEEFLIGIRPSMSKARVNIILEAFDKFDKNKDGVITIEDIKGDEGYPGGSNEEIDKRIETFLNIFESKYKEKDGRVTETEFLEHYNAISASCDSDEEFIVMMRSCWKL